MINCIGSVTNPTLISMLESIWWPCIRSGLFIQSVVVNEYNKQFYPNVSNNLSDNIKYRLAGWALDARGYCTIMTVVRKAVFWLSSCNLTYNEIQGSVPFLYEGTNGFNIISQESLNRDSNCTQKEWNRHHILIKNIFII